MIGVPAVAVRRQVHPVVAVAVVRCPGNHLTPAASRTRRAAVSRGHRDRADDGASEGTISPQRSPGSSAGGGNCRPSGKPSNGTASSPCAGQAGSARRGSRCARPPRLRDAFADGCWLVQLSPLRAPELLPRAVSEALGLPDDVTGDPARALAESLAERELLLILDTCEHLIEGCAELAALLLAAAPRLRILATSRAPLGVPGEHSLLIGPLELPADDASRRPARTRCRCSSTGRRRRCPTSRSPRQNTPAVAELCRRLDGMPLALELAAVRLRGMPVEEILARLSDRFRALGTARTATDTAPHAAGRRRLELRAVHPGRAAAVGGAFRVPRLASGSRRPSGSAGRAPARR